MSRFPLVIELEVWVLGGIRILLGVLIGGVSGACGQGFGGFESR
mgnify:CR=1 FL=1